MTLNELIEALQGLRGDDAGGGEGNNGNMEVLFDTGSRIAPISKAVCAFTLRNDEQNQVWLCEFR